MPSQLEPLKNPTVDVARHASETEAIDSLELVDIEMHTLRQVEAQVVYFVCVDFERRSLNILALQQIVQELGGRSQYLGEYVQIP